MSVITNIRVATAKALLLSLLLATPATIWAGTPNPKFALSTQIFLDEQAQAKQQVGPKRMQARSLSGDAKNASELILVDPSAPKSPVASPVTIDGEDYVSCFIHLVNPSDLSAVYALGVKLESAFEGLDFITALVPVAQLDALAELDNVTQIKVAQRMRPTTDVTRQLTHVQDLLTLSDQAKGRGLKTRYDGKGILLGILDTGIDFQHIAFKDTAGMSRIRVAVAGMENDNDRLRTYFNDELDSLFTDSHVEDHGTHTSSIAGGSSVVIRPDTMYVTNDHDSATYGGMAPGADLLLAGFYGLYDTWLAAVIDYWVRYADWAGQPVVISNSWGSGWGPRNGDTEYTDLINRYCGDEHPNHIILFAASNDAGNDQTGYGGYHVRKVDTNGENPLGTLLRSHMYTNADDGYKYSQLMCTIWADSAIACRLHVLDSMGTILHTDTFLGYKVIKDGIYDVNANGDTTFYYTGGMTVYSGKMYGKHRMALYSGPTLKTAACDTIYIGENKNYRSHYTLALEAYPTQGTDFVYMLGGAYSYFSDILTTPGHTWQRGTDDLSISGEAAMKNIITVGAYVSRDQWYNYKDSLCFKETNAVGDIAPFSSYATAEMSLTGEICPWISAPGCMLAAAVNHYHTAEIDPAYSYYGDYSKYLVVNDSVNPYALMQGTSMATPAAAGIVTLWMQAAQEVGKDLTVNEVKDILRQTAIHDSFTDGGPNASHFGYGKIDALAGIEYILSHYAKMGLQNNSANEDTISAVAGSSKIYEVTLRDRVLYKDSDWNTLCLPFSLDSFPRTLLEGATVMTLDGATSGYVGTTLTLNFTEATSIEAGKPYLVMWANDTVNPTIDNPVFENILMPTNVVAPEAVNFAGGRFVGAYSPVAFTGGDQTKLYLGACNTLYYPGADMTLGACRAHFCLDDPSLVPSRIVLNFQEQAPAISTTLQPVKTAETVKKFIRNGHLYIIRNQVTYDVTGRTVTTL